MKSKTNQKEAFNIDKYAQWTEQVWFSSENKTPDERDFTIMSLGLAGEVGEVMEILKKRVRDNHFSQNDLIKELGDVGYYWARLCRAFNLDPSQVLQQNQKKIESRKKRGKLRGSGNNR